MQEKAFYRLFFELKKIIQFKFSQVVNSSINLPIYFFAGSTFREALKRFLRLPGHRKKIQENGLNKKRVNITEVGIQSRKI